MDIDQSLKIKKLSVEDLPAIEDLLENQDSLFHMPKRNDTNAQFLSAIHYRFTQIPNSLVIYGMFQNETLLTMAGGIFGTNMPIWTLCYLHNRKDGSRHYLTTLGKLIDAVVLYAEEKGFYRFDFAAAIRNIMTYDPECLSSRLTRISAMTKRYDFYNDAVIKKNEKPEFEHHWLLLGQRLQNVDMLIRTAELKQEYRAQVNQKIKSSEGTRHAKKSYSVRQIHLDSESIEQIIGLRKRAYSAKYQHTVDLSGLEWTSEDRNGYHFGAFDGDKLISCIRLVEIKSHQQFEATLEFPSDHEFSFVPSFSLARAATDSEFKSHNLNMALRAYAYRFVQQKFPSRETYIYGTALAQSKRLDCLRELGYEFHIHQRAWKRFLFSGSSDIAIFRLKTNALSSALEKLADA